MTTSGQKWSVFSFLLVKKIPKIRGFPLISQELLGISERGFHHSLKLVDARILKKKIMTKSLLVAEIFLKED